MHETERITVSEQFSIPELRPLGLCSSCPRVVPLVVALGGVVIPGVMAVVVVAWVVMVVLVVVSVIV